MQCKEAGDRQEIGWLGSSNGIGRQDLATRLGSSGIGGGHMEDLESDSKETDRKGGGHGGGGSGSGGRQGGGRWE